MSTWVRTAALYAVIVTLFFSPVLRRGELLAPDDGTEYFVPALVTPPRIWNPYLFCGTPSFADPQTMTFYPLARLPGGLASWNVFVILGFVIAGTTMHRWIARSTRSEISGFAAGVSYALAGFLLAHLRHVNMVHTAAWMPMVFDGIDRLRGRPDARNIARTAAAAALAGLAGHPQTLVYFALAAVVYACGLARRARAAPEAGAATRRRFAAAAAAASVGGAGLAAVALLPFLDFAARSVRADLAEHERFAYSATASDLSRGFVTPALRGGRESMEAQGSASETTAFLGFVGAVFVLLAVASGIGGKRAPARMDGDASAQAASIGQPGSSSVPASEDTSSPLLLAAIGMLAAAAALGNGTWIGAGLAHVPGFDQLRAPGRWLCVVQLMGSALVGIGVSRLFLGVGHFGKGKEEARAHSERKVERRSGRRDEEARAPGRRAVHGFGGRQVRVDLQTAAAVLLLAEVVSAGWFYEWRFRGVSPDAFTMPPFLAPMKTELENTGGRFLPFLGTRTPREGGPVNRSVLWELPSVVGYNPLRNFDYADLFDLDLRSQVQWAEILGPNSAVDLAATRFLTTKRFPEENVDRILESPRWEWVATGDSVHVFANRWAMPRAWLVPAVDVVQRAEARRRIRTGQLVEGVPFDPRRVAFVEEGVPGVPRAPRETSPTAFTPLSDAVEWTVRSGALREVRVDSPEPRFLVLSEAFDSGHVAHIDGKRAPVVRTNVAFCGVAVPAGQHVIEWSYRPRMLLVGAAVSAFTAVALGASLITRRGRRRS